MKILFLDQFSEMGGAQRSLLETLAAVEQRGWQAWAAVPGAGQLVGQLQARNVPVTEIPCGPYHSGTKTIADALRFVADRKAQVRILGDLMNRVSFDLIFVNGPRLLPAAAVLASRQRTAVVFRAHSHIPQRSALNLAARSVRRANATVAACSDSVLQLFRGYIDPAKLEVIANGVPEIQFRERAFGRQAGWRIGVVGRISPEKGQAEFVHAAALLHPKFPNAKFLICGAPLFADPAYFNRVQSQARGLPVEFLGWRDDVASVFADLDLLVVPSRQEGMGRVVVEAFSAGVPVVAYPTGGIPELVVDGETGFLAPEKSSEALADRIATVMTTQPDSLRRIVANARQTWERSYTLAVYQERITDLMERSVSLCRAERETATPQRHI
ncbi:MAG: glycosyltransferase family 4 protein [Acidobacteriia bacterium]|nr:glycosyltransferase family 4 protein [Terriglobia bacterium]